MRSGNRSVRTSVYSLFQRTRAAQNVAPARGDSNPAPPTCQASTVPLGYSSVSITSPHPCSRIRYNTSQMTCVILNQGTLWGNIKETRNTVISIGSLIMEWIWLQNKDKYVSWTIKDSISNLRIIFFHSVSFFSKLRFPHVPRFNITQVKYSIDIHTGHLSYSRYQFKKNYDRFLTCHLVSLAAAQDNSPAFLFINICPFKEMDLNSNPISNQIYKHSEYPILIYKPNKGNIHTVKIHFFWWGAIWNFLKKLSVWKWSYWALWV